MANTQQNSKPSIESFATGPSAFWLCAGFLLAGMGTVLLGPILPLLSLRWHLQDSVAGLLLFAKFTGAFCGGISVPAKLRYGILAGLVAACLGIVAFAFSSGPYTGAAALFVLGLGLGLIIASTNILAGRRYSERTGSALAFINFFWSLGAVTTGILIAAFLPHYSLVGLLLCFAASFLVVALGGGLQAARPGTSANQDAQAEETRSIPLPRQAFICFCLMLFLYGGLETCLTQWLTTFSLRYTTGALLGGQSAIVVMWSALTAGRALSSVILRRVSESALQRVALVFSVALIPALAACHTAASLSAVCILLGLSLAPFFPATFALLMRRRPHASDAGFILAVSGLGAAAFSYLMGIVSTHVGSLRTAMVVPFVAALGLLCASFWKIAMPITTPES